MTKLIQTLPEEGIKIIMQENCEDFGLYVNKDEICDDVEKMNSQVSQLTQEQYGIAQEI